MTLIDERAHISDAEPEALGPIDPHEPPAELLAIDSLMAVHSGRWTFLILDGAAFMMQAMHPIIAEVTGRYSASFKGDSSGRAIRSVDSVLRWTYGGQEAIAEGNRVREMHRTLTMKSKTGKQISALNPDAYQWVIATGYLILSKAGKQLIGREFTEAEKQELIDDSRKHGRILHVPMKGYPRTPAEFDAYFEKHLPTLEASPQALYLVEELRSGRVEVPSAVPAPLRPLYRALGRPVARLGYLSVIGLLDPRLRDVLGVTWTAEEQKQFERRFTIIRRLYDVLPDRLTYFPLAYHARKHHQCIQQMKEREKKSYIHRVEEFRVD